MRKAFLPAVFLAAALLTQTSAGSAAMKARTPLQGVDASVAPAHVALFAQQRGSGNGRARSFRFVKRPIKEQNRRLKYTIDASYPQLIGAKDASALQFNHAAKELMIGAVNDFKKDFAAPDPDVPEELQQSSFDAGYTVDYSSPDLISISFGISTYYAGAAHPNHYSTVLNYDLKTGRTLSLSDLFNARSGYMQAISAYTIKALKKKLGPDPDTEWIERGAAPSSENYKSWNVTPRGLSVTFDPYQVASYAEGQHVVLIPYAALRNVINTDGPLGPFVKKVKR